MSSQKHSSEYFSVKEHKTPPPTSTISETDEPTRSVCRRNLASDMVQNILCTKSGLIPKSKEANSRIDKLKIDLSALRGKLLFIESLVEKYRNAMNQSEDKVDCLMNGIAAVVENFETALKSSETKNKAASREMSFVLKDTALLVLTRHEKDLFEDEEIFNIATSSLHVLIAEDDDV